MNQSGSADQKHDENEGKVPSGIVVLEHGVSIANEVTVTVIPDDDNLTAMEKTTKGLLETIVEKCAGEGGAELQGLFLVLGELMEAAQSMSADIVTLQEAARSDANTIKLLRQAESEQSLTIDDLEGEVAILVKELEQLR